MFRTKSLSVLLVVKASLCFALAFASCATAPPPGGVPMAVRPDWTNDGMHEGFNRQVYLTAVGHGNSRQAAEMDAFRQLVTIFGVDVQADTRLAEAYRSGAGGVGTHSIDFGSEIILGAGMDNLIGVEIGDRWDNGRGTFSALAVLNRARATQIYSDMIRANQELIANLTTLTPIERNSFSGFSRYQFAAVVADMNASYAAVLAAVGSPMQGLRTGDDFRREAQAIATAIPIGINVTGDRAGRIQGSFAGAMTGLGFRTGGVNQRYILQVNVIVTEPQFAGGQRNIVWAQMELSASLVDTATGAALLPFYFSGREGHTNFERAENIVFNVAQRQIEAEFGNLLEDFLFQLIPGR